MSTDVNASLQTLLKAFASHEDLRKQHAGIPALATSSHELYMAGMAAYRATR